MVSHLPINYFGMKNISVLIIGGGDGGSLFYALKHSNVGLIYVVDIDESVVRYSHQYFPLYRNAFTNKRATILIEDGAVFVKRTSLKFDLIIIDSTDYGQSDSLKTHNFYLNCKNILHEKGIIVRNVESPTLTLNFLQKYQKEMARYFKNVHFYISFIQSFATGEYCFIFLSDYYHPIHSKIDWKYWENKNISTQYYNFAIHYGSFILPNYINDIISPGMKI